MMEEDEQQKLKMKMIGLHFVIFLCCSSASREISRNCNQQQLNREIEDESGENRERDGAADTPVLQREIWNSHTDHQCVR